VLKTTALYTQLALNMQVNQAPVNQSLKQLPPLALTFIDCYKMILWINL
jgi:hypothetical protein